MAPVCHDPKVSQRFLSFDREGHVMAFDLVAALDLVIYAKLKLYCCMMSIVAVVSRPILKSADIFMFLMITVSIIVNADRVL
jgi:hypothetical protein